MSNRLGGATSPYLLQHADNPVDWYQWGDEAFAAARERDVPVFLSVGYAACHWCHVMAHESFEDPDTAAVLNAGFVSVKVDREERPDVDAVYMAATQAMTGQGGWPMSVMLTPAGEPFFAGTYFPGEPRQGMPSFRQVLDAVTKAWRERRGELEKAGAEVAQHLRASMSRPSVPGDAASGGKRPAADDSPTAWDAVSQAAISALAADFDPRHGGFGGAPKFPPSMVLDFLLNRSARTGDERALAMAETTLTAMARGGIYDQLGGGFARYGVDAGWQVPHFEKMLYDNAQLLAAYTRWWQVTGSGLARRVARDTLDFLLRELTTPQGGFASSLDADSDGREGAFYVWTPEELGAALGERDAGLAAQWFGVGERGNVEPVNVENSASTLRLAADPPDRAEFERLRARLFEIRAQRVRPACDDKVVSAWNGLAIDAVARAGVAFGDQRAVQAAVGAAELLASVHMRSDGTLARASRAGIAGEPQGLLEDYSCAGSAFLTLFGITGDIGWFERAGRLIGQARQRFASQSTDGPRWYDTASGAEALIARPSDPSDNVTPSGQSALAALLVTWAGVTGERRARDDAVALLAANTALISRYPRMAGHWLSVVEALADGPAQLAVVGAPGDASADDLVRAGLALRRPGLVLARGTGGESPVALLDARTPVDGRPAAYLCRDFTCDLPVTDPSALAALDRR